VAPSVILPWVLLAEEIYALYGEGHGTTPDLIYAKGVLDTPDPGQTNVNEKSCILILIEIEFSRNLGCDKKHAEKTEKYSPLVAALQHGWGRVEFVAIPIGYAGTTLTRTLDHLTATFSTVRPRQDQVNANKGTSQATTNSNATSHDYRLIKSLLDELTNLA